MGLLLLPLGSWCAQGSVCALQESVSLVLCKFWKFYGGVNGHLLQESLCHTQVCCTQSPCPCGRPLLTRTLTVDTQTQFWLSFCGLGMCLVPFPGLNSSGDQVLGQRTVSASGSCLRSKSMCVMCPCWRADLRLRPSWQMSAIQDLRKKWLAAGSLLTVWWKMPSPGLRCPL